MNEHIPPYDVYESSFLELAPRERLAALLDEDFTELLGPFDRVSSPWLEQQGLIPQSDDGVVVVRGTVDGQPVVAVAIEPAFEGGSIGEVGGAKIATALTLAAESCRAGLPMAALLLLESGGVRLGEANLGIAAIADIQRAIIVLRELAPVVVVIAGPTGCFGGMSLAAALCSTIIGTPHGRLGMNGPEVIEQEAGPEELDAADREQIWQMIGCEARRRDGFVDAIAKDSASSIGAAVRDALAAGVSCPQRIAGAHARLAVLREQVPASPIAQQATTPSRGRHWIELLCGEATSYIEGVPSVLRGELIATPALVLAVVPDAASRFPRAAHGEMGLEQAYALAACIRDWTAEQQGSGRPIVAIVDTPGQAFGRVEEQLCISAACAAAVDAYAAARRAGHPVITLVVGRAISGSFLAHGMQSDAILAFDDERVMMHAMSQESIARITRRTIAEVASAAAKVVPMSYAIAQAHRLGIIHTLLHGICADDPTPANIEAVQSAIASTLNALRSGSFHTSIDGNPLRVATTTVRRGMRDQWHALDTLQHAREKESFHHAGNL